MNILVLCTGNSCRSQIADGLLKREFGNGHTILSAGVEVHGVNPRAIKIMDEIDIDISGNTSNHVDEYLDIQFDYVITVCDHAAEVCPVFPGGTKRVHHSFNDPAKATGTEEEIMSEFRTVRNQIEEFARDFYKNVSGPAVTG